MTQQTDTGQLFSGLILLTGEDKAGISEALFECLSPFAVSILDIDQIIIKQRLILTLQISLNPSHQEAISADLDLLAQRLDVDIAYLFSLSDAPTDLVDQLLVTVESSKMLPRYLHSFTYVVNSLGGNIERYNRVLTQPLSLQILVSGVSAQELNGALVQIESDELFTITVA